jgi:predicted N-acyltransferase
VLFPSDHEADLMDEAGMMMRHGVQFHWTNPGYENFDAFLATLSQKKRKNIRAERRRVTEAGITFRHLRGPTSTTRRGASTAAIARPTAITTPRPT